MTRTAAIGLGAIIMGVVGAVLLDHFAYGAVHTILTALLLGLLIAGVLLLHRTGLEIEQDMRHAIRRGRDQGP